MGDKQKIMFRFYLVSGGLLLFSFLLIGKLCYMVLVDGDAIKQKSEQTLIESRIQKPSRGNIYASDGSILAISIPKYELRWDATVPASSLYEKNKISLSKGLAGFSGRTPKAELARLENARAENKRYSLIAKNLSFADYQELKALPLFNLKPYVGGSITKQDLSREHPLGNVAARTIGYERRQTDGTSLKIGLEGAFSHYLSGEPGSRLMQKIANGEWKPINDANEKEPTSGFDIHTTLDVNFQDIAHTALLQQLEKYNADHGCVVVMEVETGAVKAISNLGKTSRNTYSETYNYAVGERVEPGSTFKTMAFLAALEDDVIQPFTKVNTGDGKLRFFGKFDVKDTKIGGHGILTAAKVVEVSSNVGIVKIINDQYKSNPKRFVDRLFNMGLNKPLGISIRGEPAPQIPYPSERTWDGLDLPWMAYGYGVSMTALQILAFYNAIANKGEMVKPRFITRIGKLGETPEKTVGKVVINPSIASENTLEIIQKILANVVEKEWGTANSIQDETLKMAGKTGTTQLDYTTDTVQYISSFVGYFPADQPKYSCIVMIHRPDKTKGYYGATVAAPVFKQIAKRVQNTIPKAIMLEQSVIDSLQPKVFKTVGRLDKIPDLRGYSIRDALLLLEQSGLEVIIKGSGRVSEQSIAPGKRIKQGQKIILRLS